jgi:hypothetical protein
VTAKSDPAPPDAAVALARRLGIGPGATVQEIGYDTDTEELVGEAIQAGSGEDPVGDDYDGVVDVALLWWREGDGDLADVLVDVMAPLVEGGVIWLFTPKFGRRGAVEPADIAEASESAGMRRTTTVSLPKWSATRLVVR